MIVWLAPMDWVTDCAYRIICKEEFLWSKNLWGHVEDDTLMLWTEFMSADGYCHNPPWVVRHVQRCDYEPELIVQIFGGNADTLLNCAEDVAQRYEVAWIEINMWCPSPKIMKCAAWSGMLKDKQKTLGILKHLSDSLSVPLSLKTRLGLNRDDIPGQYDFLVEAAQYVWMIGIHGRLYNQWHSGDVDWEFIKSIKEASPSTVVVGNWWVRDYEGIIEKSEGLDGVMIAQAAIGNPWSLTVHQPTVEHRFATIMRHLWYAMACEEFYRADRLRMEQWAIDALPVYAYTRIQERGAEILATASEESAVDYQHFKTPLEFRTYLFRYIVWLPGSKDLKKKLPAARELWQLIKVLHEYKQTLIS